MKNVLISGAGLLGLSIAYQLSKDSKNYRVTVIEKERKFGKHQSGNNSGVLHCGLYYQPGSLKARLAVQGIRDMVSFCEDQEVNHEICGKVVVATDDYEVGLLLNLAERGKQNGLSGLKILSNSELKLREPHLRAKAVLLVPEEGIVDFKQVMAKLEKGIFDNGGTILYNSNVNDVVKVSAERIVLACESSDKQFDLFINCSGLHADRIYSKMTGKVSPIKIVPFRGEYLHFEEKYRELVNQLIYPVPDPKYPFLGVHFTRMIGGGREVGPNAVLALKREGYLKSDFSLKDSFESLTYAGFLNFLTKNAKFAFGEFISSMSRAAFIKKAQKLVPEVQPYMFNENGTSGVRAQALDKKGNLIMDFKVERFNNQIHILNAPSPGATASLAIASYIIEEYIHLGPLNVKS